MSKVGLVTVWNVSVPGEDAPFGGYSWLDQRGEPRPVYETWWEAVDSRVERVAPARLQ